MFMAWLFSYIGEYIMLRKTRYAIRRFLGNITKRFERDPFVIMWIDGGFCSQIAQYIKGRWFAKRGFRVKYDLSWYKNNSMDLLRVERRDFLLLKCFPDLDFERPFPGELIRYRTLYATNIHNTEKKYKGHYESLKAPLYNFEYDLNDLVATENDFEELAECINWEGLHDMLGSEARKIEQSIMRDKRNGLKVIGLHVRRGDMAIKKFAYGGKVLTSKYYEYILNRMIDRNSVIYVFSNGFDFVESEVKPYIKCKNFLVNTTSQVYEDMFLCSLCDVQIAGQGTMGRQAYSFNRNRNRKLICPFINDDDDEKLPKYYAGSFGTVEFVSLSEDMYE